MIPRRSASASAAVRSCTLNFRKMLLMCALAVSPLIPSAAAISLFLFPVASSSSTWDSRNVSEGWLARCSSDCRNLRRDRALARVHVADDANQIVGQRVLQEVAHRPGGDRPVRCPRRRGTSSDTTIRASGWWLRIAWIACTPFMVGISRSISVTSGRYLRNCSTACSPSLACCHNGHVGLDADDAGDALAHQAVIIDAEDANCAGHPARYSAANGDRGLDRRADARAADDGEMSAQPRRALAHGQQPEVLARSGAGSCSSGMNPQPLSTIRQHGRGRYRSSG